MRILLLTVLVASSAAAQSHPSWWNYASPDATSLVGIHWDNLRQSPFASPIQSELSTTGSLGFPDLDCLRQARELILSSPPFLAVEAGKFPAAAVQKQAMAVGLRRTDYFGVTMWLPAQTASLGVAQISDSVLLVGTRKSLEASVHQSLLETGRRYSPLLMRGARFSQNGDLWVVSVELPDPLASLFVPIDVEGHSFEGVASVRDGLNLEASFEAPSDAIATKTAAELRKDDSILPGLARRMHIVTDAKRIVIDLQLTQDQLSTELRVPQAAPTPVPVRVLETARVIDTPKPVQPAVPTAPGLPDLKPPQESAPLPALPPAPQVVRIVGLDSGPIEIPYPVGP